MKYIEKVNIELTKEEAIVFFEFLGRFNENGDLSKFEDQSEQRVLWDIECILEKQLSEPFKADYLEIVSRAREQVRGQRMKTHHNSTYKKLAVQWLNGALCFVSSLVVADSLVLRNRQLLVAANRSFVKPNSSTTTPNNKFLKMNKINRLILIALLNFCWGKTISQTTDSLSVFPNPFNSSATIHFSIMQIDTITLKVFNVVGETVRTFFQSTVLPSGTYNINLLGDGLADGIYFIRLNIGSTNTLTEKVVKSGLTKSVDGDKSAKNKFVVYPNPTTDYLTIPIEGNKTIIITDLSGQILKSITTHQQTISLLDLTVGQYFITISTNTSGIITTQKIFLK